MKLNLLLGALVLLIAILVLLRLRVEGFATGDTQVIIAKASWCGHCKVAMPEFEKLVAASPIAFPGGSAVVTMLDADADKEKLAPYAVKGFPTILVIHKGERLEYPGDRTAAGVTEFLQSL